MRLSSTQTEKSSFLVPNIEAKLGGAFVRDTSLSSLTDYFLDSVKKGNPFLFTLNPAEEPG